MKPVKIVILFLAILSFVSCSQVDVDQKSADGNEATVQQKSEDVNAIPYPKKEWKGVQGKTLADSKPDFIGQPKAPEGAPNVLIIMLDDAGYSNATSYGGIMKMPVFDRVEPAPPVADPRTTRLALVTSGGIVPRGNPDRIESASAGRFGAYFGSL